MPRRAHILSICLAVLAITGLTVGAVGSAVATDHHDESAFLVDIDADGDAIVTLVLTFDLEDDDELEAFENLRTDDDALTDVHDRFASSLGELATDAATQTEREMSISDAEIELYTSGDGVGVVELSIRWHGLAAANGDTITVSEPFASGFALDQQLIVVSPENYEPTTVRPDASDSDDRTLIWDTGSDLEGFEVTFTAVDDGEPSDDEGTDTDVSDDESPGFGVVVGVLAILVAIIGLINRRVA